MECYKAATKIFLAIGTFASLEMYTSQILCGRHKSMLTMYLSQRANLGQLCNRVERRWTALTALMAAKTEHGHWGLLKRYYIEGVRFGKVCPDFD